MSEKPKFDPTQPFDTVKPKFDPSKPFDSLPTGAATQPSEMSKLESALRGVAQGSSLGFVDELSGGAGALAGKLGLVPNKGYEYYRDYARGQDRLAQSTNPKTYGAGQIGGGVATMALPGLSALQAGGNAVKGGAATGALMGAGASENDLASLPGAADVALGTLTGAGGGVAGNAIGKVASGAPEVAGWLRDAAKSLAGRALGAERGSIKTLGDQAVKDAGGYALDNGILSLFGNTSDKIAKNAAKQAEAGAAQEGVYKTLDAYGPSKFNPLDVGAKIEDKIGGFWRSPINRGETKQLENTLESVIMRGDKDIPLAEAQALKEELGKVANWKNKLNITDKERMARDAYGVVANEIENAAAQGAKDIGVKGLAETLRNANKTYSSSKVAEQLLENKNAREAGNKIIGLTDAMIAGPAFMTHALSAPQTIAAVLAKKAVEKYGPQATALGLNSASKGMSSLNNALGGFAPLVQAGTQAAAQGLSNKEILDLLSKQNKQSAADYLRNINKGAPQ